MFATYLKSLRNEAKFDLFYDIIFHDCRNLTEEPSLPRHRKVPKRLDDGGLASFPGPIRGGEKGLVSTVCACA